RLFDHARSGKADQGIRLSKHDIADHRKTRRYPAHGRVREYRNERQLFGRELGQRGAGFRHLHQREQAFLHARTAARSKAYQWQLLFEAQMYSAYKALAHYRTHRAAEKSELECGSDQRCGFDAALHDHQRVVFLGIFLGFFETLDVTPAVLELESIDRHDLVTDFVAAFGVEQIIEARARTDAIM